MMRRKSVLQGLGVIVLFLFAMLMIGTMQVYAATAVESYGALQVSGTKLVSQKTGDEVQLRGVSTHGIMESMLFAWQCTRRNIMVIATKALPVILRVPFKAP
jgi:hypothetical protein